MATQKLVCVKAREAAKAKHPLFGEIQLVPNVDYDLDEAEIKRLGKSVELVKPAVASDSDEQE